LELSAHRQFAGRFAVGAVLCLFTLQSCTRAVDVPFGEGQATSADVLYRIVVIDGRVFEARSLIVKQDGVTFNADGKRYEFDKHQIVSVQELRVDKARTAIEIVVIVTGLYFLLKAYVESFPGTR
jgi:hypothetical protein